MAEVNSSDSYMVAAENTEGGYYDGVESALLAFQEFYARLEKLFRHFKQERGMVRWDDRVIVLDTHINGWAGLMTGKSWD